MAVEITLGGNGRWRGGSAEIENYSVDEEATPLNAADTSGAVPSLNFDVDAPDDLDDLLLLYGTPVTLTDGSNGSTFGTITDIGGTDGNVSLSTESPLSALVPEQVIPPFVGTLQGAINALLQQVQVAIPIAYDPGLAAEARPVAMQGWYGSPWEWLKMMAIAHRFEVAIIGEAIAVRRVRQREINTETDSSRGMSVQRGPLALNIEAVRYRNTFKQNAIVYPSTGWTEELDVYTVDADEELEVEIPIDVSLMSIEQPTCVAMVPKVYNGPSVYTVSGDDGLVIPPAMWKAYGGSVSIEIGEDTKSIILKVKGPSLQQYAPYSLSVNSGLSETYSTLRLRGTGVHFTREVRRYATGASSKIARQEVGVTIDNPTIQSDAQFASLVLSAARQFSMPTHTISGTALVANRAGAPGLVRYMTFGEFKAARPDPYKLSSWKTEFSGMTFRQIRAALRAESSPSTDFQNQAFGNVVGSTTRYGSSSFRVRRATIGPASIQWEAEADTTFAQVKAAHLGKTFRQLRNERLGLTFGELALTPLSRHSTAPPPVGSGFGLGPFGHGPFGGGGRDPQSGAFGLGPFGLEPFGL